MCSTNRSTETNDRVYNNCYIYDVEWIGVLRMVFKGWIYGCGEDHEYEKYASDELECECSDDRVVE